MDVHHNDSENCIDDPEDFRQYCSWLLCAHKDKKNPTNKTRVSTPQLDGGSDYHMLTNINMFTYIRPLKCNVQVLSGNTAPEKGLLLS